MMLIQLILIAGLGLVLVWFVRRMNAYQLQASKILFSLVFFLIAVSAILYPDLLSWLADFVGVSRGADLLFYMLTLAFIGHVANTHLIFRKQHDEYVKLARKLALLEAQHNNKKPRKS